MSDGTGRMALWRSRVITFLRPTLAICLLLVSAERFTMADDGSTTPQLSSRVPSLPDKFRGEKVTVAGKNFPTEGVKIWLRSGKERPNDKGIPLDAAATADGNSVSFTLPKYPGFDAGRYLVFVEAGATELAVPGELHVLADQAAPVRVDSISPATAYPSDDTPPTFYIAGQNLAQAASENLIEVVGQGPLPVGNPAECSTYEKSKDYKKVCLFYEPGMETRRLTVKGYRPAHYQGPVKFQVRVRDTVSEPEQVVFSVISEGGLRALAAIASVGLALIIFLTVSGGIRRYKLGGETLSPGAMFLLDGETGSYSLSKFQILAWTAVAVFSYLYVLFCRTLIQWRFVFPEIPSGWPTLLGLSAGATVTAMGITRTRGAKGAGDIKPTIADFISSGGLVLGDRFQFFVWTLVGCLGFLVLMLLSDPATLKDLPDVPQGFLYLMGVSAAGYLGGKMVRLPGPVIKQIFAGDTPPDGSTRKPADPGHRLLTISLKGDNISKNASVRVDEDDLRKDQFEFSGGKPEDPLPDPSFCSEIFLTLREGEHYLEGTHKLTVTNPDGQMAVSMFPIDPLKVDPFELVAGGAKVEGVRVTGANFGTNMTATWKAADALSAKPISADDVKRVSASELVISLVPGGPGVGRFSLSCASGLEVGVAVGVKPGVPPMAPPPSLR